MSNQYLVITLLSNDQPSIVKQLADVISQHNGNWLESRMSQLAGKFASILKVSIDTKQLLGSLETIEGKLGIDITISEQL
ncbi:hypothetical protein AB835_10610 [Candidatus Endobugula sertula]|uniref:ACT domain-containing protein n=1 Tax=Candidatus Endobugula sertula TaxID=62101 RepID=A0A1D2QND5_9GAMM|nr:hypothetical protein AB835_10610 [Candidatus Endobugula sertula]